ncbi:hypothetical protein [Hippea jasoniae]|uniref:hypothetical protein n=1 Tax=Hippea jasoniae TaxID=944479 RepID=UPI0005501BBD|nr:hypothetical protein [Hippea jasoniae]
MKKLLISIFVFLFLWQSSIAKNNPTKKDDKIKQAQETIEIANKSLKELKAELKKHEKLKRDALQDMLEDATGVHMKPHYAEGAPHMYNHIPTDHEVMHNLSPSTRFEDERRTVNRLKNEIKAVEKAKKEAEKILKNSSK